MTGVSYMIPFVAAGGLLIALSFLFGGYEIVGPAGDRGEERRARDEGRVLVAVGRERGALHERARRRGRDRRR